MSVIASESQAKVANTTAALGKVEAQLSGLLKLRVSDVLRNLAPLESAEFQVTMLYAVASIYYCHLLAQGFDPKDHPIRQELDRIQLYFNKVRNTVVAVAARSEERGRLSLDAEVANRMLRHYVAAAEAANQRQREAKSFALPTETAPSAPEVLPSAAREDVEKAVEHHALSANDPLPSAGKTMLPPASKRYRCRSRASGQQHPVDSSPPKPKRARGQAATAEEKQPRSTSSSVGVFVSRARFVVSDMSDRWPSCEKVRVASKAFLKSLGSQFAEVSSASPRKRKRKRKLIEAM
mmetsp:Transcript_48986/g.116517  ORF Transcript_48986/g.116517 Transcript_48986/m.116517 type:complete len:294 (-) Transcript_48986:13-894(-)